MRPSLVTQKSFLSQIGDDTVLFVRPGRVEQMIATKWPKYDTRFRSDRWYLPAAVAKRLRQALKVKEPFVIQVGYYGTPTTVTETPRYKKIEDFIRHCDHPEDTIWFNELLSEVEREGAAQHKKIVMLSVSDIHDFFDSYVTPMIESLRCEGYKVGKAGYESCAFVDAQGHLTKAGSGNHRFAICKALDLSTFPLRVIGVHSEWYAREVMPNGDNWPSLQTALSRVAEESQ